MKKQPPNSCVSCSGVNYICFLVVNLLLFCYLLGKSKLALCQGVSLAIVCQCIGLAGAVQSKCNGKSRTVELCRTYYNLCLVPSLIAFSALSALTDAILIRPVYHVKLFFDRCANDFGLVRIADLNLDRLFTYRCYGRFFVL